MFATVIPAIRTPRTVGGFDYVIPADQTVGVGDLVQIPFRNVVKVGIVHSIQEDPPKGIPKCKELLGRYADLRMRPQSLQLLEALAKRSFCSLPSVLHAWLGQLPKKPETIQASKPVTGTQMTSETRFDADPETALLRDVMVLSKSPLRILIIVPWAGRASRIATQLNASVLTSQSAMGARFKAWSTFVQGASNVLVTTRLGAWLSTEADIVLLNEPENDDHKQDELSPRFDARWITEAAQQFGIPVRQYGTTPPLRTFTNPTLPTRIPTLEPDLIGIDIHRADWSDIPGLQNRTVIEIERAIKAKRPISMIHPIHGDRAALRCSDCSWQASCSRCGASLHLQQQKLLCKRCNQHDTMSPVCPVCRGTDLSKSRPGRERMESALARYKPAPIQIHSIGSWNTAKIPEKGLIVLSDLSLFVGSTEDLRKQEQRIIHGRRLATEALRTQSTLVVQADSSLLTAYKSWLKTEGCELAMREELKERALFRLPPAWRLVKIIIRGNEGHVKRQKSLLEQRLQPNDPFILNGPYEVQHVPNSRAQRFILHLSAPQGTPLKTIEYVLEPLMRTDVLLDLDPIAFFE
ncbi:hypothetical protein GF380_04060 [Candidatus Uhrbacteria bacterium]|nr:hypothetical protein [Candidatus Uhrbacteria bacterium]MBD3284258.1 hypothetical protein [Candidatus Uhrbacteria bacterium]